MRLFLIICLIFSVTFVGRNKKISQNNKVGFFIALGIIVLLLTILV